MSDVYPSATPKTGQTTIATTATQLAAPTTGSSTGVGRACSGVVIKAPSTNTATVFVGPASVTTSNGYPLEAGASLPFPVDDPSRWYGIVAAATQPLAYVYL